MAFFFINSVPHLPSLHIDYFHFFHPVSGSFIEISFERCRFYFRCIHLFTLLIFIHSIPSQNEPFDILVLLLLSCTRTLSKWKKIVLEKENFFSKELNYFPALLFILTSYPLSSLCLHTHFTVLLPISSEQSFARSGDEKDTVTIKQLKLFPSRSRIRAPIWFENGDHMQSNIWRRKPCLKHLSHSPFQPIWRRNHMRMQTIRLETRRVDRHENEISLYTSFPVQFVNLEYISHIFQRNSRAKPFLEVQQTSS